MIADNLNPEFVTEILTDYYFEEIQNFLVDVYDVDDASSLHDLRKQEFIGSYPFKLGNLISSRNQEATGDLSNPSRKNSGKVKVMVSQKEDNHGKEVVKLHLSMDLSKQV